MIRPATMKNRLTFGGDLVPDTDSVSLFRLHHHCGMQDFRRFISISHTVTDRFSRHSAKWVTPTRQWIHNILGAMRQTPGSEPGVSKSNNFWIDLWLYLEYGLK